MCLSQPLFFHKLTPVDDDSIIRTSPTQRAMRVLLPHKYLLIHILQETHHPHNQLFNHMSKTSASPSSTNKLLRLQQTHFEPSEFHQSQSHAMTCALAAASVKEARLLLEEAEATTSKDTFRVCFPRNLRSPGKVPLT